MENKNDDFQPNKAEVDSNEWMREDTSQTDVLPEKKNNKGLLGIGAAILLFLAKFKALIVLLKLGKFASTFVSMFLMIVVYAKMYGFAFGAGFVLLLLIHEMGHYLIAKRLQLNVSLPLFIPFVGAFINMREMPSNAEIEAKVGLGGPILGSIGAFLCMIAYYLFKWDLLLALAYIGFMINLFNLVPIRPLDGGRVVTAISPWLWLIGIPIAIVFLYKHPNPILIVILIFGIVEIVNSLKRPNKEYFKVEPAKRVVFAVVYFGLLLALGLGMTYIHALHAGLTNTI